MDENELTKTELWTKRIQDFHESGLSRKEWCQEHQTHHQPLIIRSGNKQKNSQNQNS